MDQGDEKFGRINPKAPQALSQFAFLIGSWRCEAKVFDGQSMVYWFQQPVASHAYDRATYTNMSPAHFTWRGEASSDAKTWSEFLVVEAYC